MDTLEARLRAAVKPHDLLCHPFYQAWSTGRLTRADLADYAAQYRHQVQALPALLRAAHDRAGDASTRAALARNLAEELGDVGPAHAKLWDDFAAVVGAQTEPAQPETRDAHASLAALVDAGEVEALAALWAYELQTAHVAATKVDGLAKHHGIDDPGSVAFFALHGQLDVHHASELLAAIDRACAGDAQREERACQAAARSAQAQWRFLDGPERRRLAAA